jgi:hypothetical protein
MTKKTPKTITSRASNITKICLDCKQKIYMPEKKINREIKIA